MTRATATFVWSLGLLGGCPKSGIPKEDLQDELPGWREDGEEVRLELAKDLLATQNTLGALDIVRVMRSEGYDGAELDLIQGTALRIDGVASEAERLLLTAQKRMPKDSRPAAELCILYADTERLPDAIDRCQRATDIDPTNGKAWNNLSYLQLVAERPAESLAAAEKAIEIDAVEPRYRNNLAMAQAALGREDQAFRTLQSTMAKADAAYMVGIVVERFEGIDVARPWYERALEIDPNQPQAKSRLEPDSPSPNPNPPVEEP